MKKGIKILFVFAFLSILLLLSCINTKTPIQDANCLPFYDENGIQTERMLCQDGETLELKEI